MPIILRQPPSGDKIYSRIISLVPSQTELLSFLGLDEQVIGITRFCIHPESWFRKKTRVGGTRQLNATRIRELVPDLLIANKEENEKGQIEALSNEFDILVTEVSDLASATDMIRDVGRITGRAASSAALADQITGGFGKLIEMAPLEKKRAAYLIWKDPFMVAGGDTFISDMMQYAGWENVFADCKRYPATTLEEIGRRGCRQVLLSSEPYPFTRDHLEEIARQLPGMEVLMVEGEMFSWYGSRLLKSIDYFHSFLSKR